MHNRAQLIHATTFSFFQLAGIRLSNFWGAKELPAFLTGITEAGAGFVFVSATLERKA
jgi:hypothetical protein